MERSSTTQQLKECVDFEEKLKRAVYLDNLSPLVTIPILRTSLGQFGVVVAAQILPNYLDPKNAAVSALVEMQNERQSQNTVREINCNAFVIAGMAQILVLGVSASALVQATPHIFRAARDIWSSFRNSKGNP